MRLLRGALDNELEVSSKLYKTQKIIFGLAIAALFIVVSCSDKGPTSVTEDPEKGSIEGQTITSDTQEGINDAFVILSAQNITDRETYTEDGKFQFSNLDHGEYQLKIRLPQGYSENDNLERIITVDGPVNIEVRADPVREQTSTIQKGTVDTVATSSGVYLTVDATESDADVELHIEEIDDDVFSGQQILSKPVQIRFGPNNGGSASGGSNSLQGNLSASTGSENLITMHISPRYNGNPDEAMFTFQLDEEAPVLAYAEGIPKEYLDSRVNQGTQVMQHEISLSPEAEFKINVALTRLNDSCEYNDRSFKELQGDLQLQGDKPLILIHGIQPFKKTCKDFENYDPANDLFGSLISEFRNNPVINNSYRLYTYKYTSNTSILANSEILWEMMLENGIEEPVIIGHSMGGLVTRGLMLSKGKDKVSGLITLGTPHEGTQITDLAYNINAVTDQFVCGPKYDPIKDLARYYFCIAKGLNTVIVPPTNGFNDLNPNSELISQLNSLDKNGEKIYALAGNLNSDVEWDPILMRPRFKFPETALFYKAGWTYLGLLGSKSDGMVPLKSAIPDWSSLQEIAEDHHHSEVARGVFNGTYDDVSVVMSKIKNVLSELSGSVFIPQLVTKEVTEITFSSAVSGGQISNDGGADVTERGVCWSTSQNPDLNDNCTSDGSGVGEFTSSLTELNPDTEYFVRAYATNEQGTGYGDEKSFTTEVETGSGDWPRDTETEVVDVTNPATGQTWMDRNLGASRAATSMDDEEAYGDLYQWGRATDGHQKRNSGTTSTLSSTDTPGHGDFILAPNPPYDWRSLQNDNLWQGVNDPCPDGYRLPTEAEWEAERQSWSNNYRVGAFESPLKLPVAGYRYVYSGSLEYVGSRGGYWSSSVSGTYSRRLMFHSGTASMRRSARALGFSIRCIKD